MEAIEKAKMIIEEAQSKIIASSGVNQSQNFKDDVAKDPIAAAKNYFSSPHMKEDTKTLNSMYNGSGVSDNSFVNLSKNVASSEELYKRNLLSEGLGINSQKLELELQRTGTPEEKAQAEQRIQENKQYLEEIGTRAIHLAAMSRNLKSSPEQASGKELIENKTKISVTNRMFAATAEKCGGMEAVGKLGASEKHAIQIATYSGDTTAMLEAADRVKKRQAALLDSGTVEIPVQSKEDLQAQKALEAKQSMLARIGKPPTLRHVEPTQKSSNTISTSKTSTKQKEEKALPEIDVEKMKVMFKRIERESVRNHGSNPMGPVKQKDKSKDQGVMTGR